MYATPFGDETYRFSATANAVYSISDEFSGVFFYEIYNLFLVDSSGRLASQEVFGRFDFRIESVSIYTIGQPLDVLIWRYPGQFSDGDPARVEYLPRPKRWGTLQISLPTVTPNPFALAGTPDVFAFYVASNDVFIELDGEMRIEVSYVPQGPSVNTTALDRDPSRPTSLKTGQQPRRYVTFSAELPTFR